MYLSVGWMVTCTSPRAGWWCVLLHGLDGDMHLSVAWMVMCTSLSVCWMVMCTSMWATWLSGCDYIIDWNTSWVKSVPFWCLIKDSVSKEVNLGLQVGGRAGVLLLCEETNCTAKVINIDQLTPRNWAWENTDQHSASIYIYATGYYLLLNIILNS